MRIETHTQNVELGPKDIRRAGDRAKETRHEQVRTFVGVLLGMLPTTRMFDFQPTTIYKTGEPANLPPMVGPMDQSIPDEVIQDWAPLAQKPVIAAIQTLRVVDNQGKARERHVLLDLAERPPEEEGEAGRDGDG